MNINLIITHRRTKNYLISIVIFSISINFSLSGIVSKSVYAAEIASTTQMSFGSIIADPSGEEIEIDASAGAAVPQKVTGGISNITGGASGTIRISSTIAGQAIQTDYPTNITLTSGSDTMSVNGIAARSITVSTTVFGFVQLHVGGLLHINPGQAAGSYSGTMPITVNYP